jgi:hypothetical protein
VTLVKITDPAQGADQCSPDDGKRFVGVVFTIEGLCRPKDMDADRASVIGSDGQTYSAELKDIAGYTNLHHGTIHVTRRETLTGSVNVSAAGRGQSGAGPVDPRRRRLNGRVEGWLLVQGPACVFGQSWSLHLTPPRASASSASGKRSAWSWRPTRVGFRPGHPPDGDSSILVREVHAMKSKVLRAERGRALRAGQDPHGGNVPELEDELCLLMPGEVPVRSPDRADAAVYAIFELRHLGQGGSWLTVYGMSTCPKCEATLGARRLRCPSAVTNGNQTRNPRRTMTASRRAGRPSTRRGSQSAR